MPKLEQLQNDLENLNLKCIEIEDQYSKSLDALKLAQKNALTYHKVASGNAPSQKALVEAQQNLDLAFGLFREIEAQVEAKKREIAAFEKATAREEKLRELTAIADLIRNDAQEIEKISLLGFQALNTTAPAVASLFFEVATNQMLFLKLSRELGEPLPNDLQEVSKLQGAELSIRINALRNYASDGQAVEYGAYFMQALDFAINQQRIKNMAVQSGMLNAVQRVHSQE